MRNALRDQHLQNWAEGGTEVQYSHNKNQGSSRAGMAGLSKLSHFEARGLVLLIPTLKKHWMWAFPREGM